MKLLTITKDHWAKYIEEDTATIVATGPEGEISIQDYAVKQNGDDYQGFYGRWMSQMAEDSPKQAFQVMEYSKATSLEDNYLKLKYRVNAVLEITEDEFFEMLDVLPPCNWTIGANPESFRVSEAFYGTVYGWFVRYKMGASECSRFFSVRLESPVGDGSIKHALAKNEAERLCVLYATNNPKPA